MPYNPASRSYGPKRHALPDSDLEVFPDDDHSPAVVGFRVGFDRRGRRKKKIKSCDVLDLDSSDDDSPPPTHVPPADFISRDQVFDFTETLDEFNIEKQKAEKQPRERPHYIEKWDPFTQEYFNELIRLESPYPFPLRCEDCNQAYEVLYRCQDCFGNLLYCRDCTTRVHKTSPLHSILQWNGKCFHPVTLFELGLVVCLGGHDCPLSKPAEKPFVVIDSVGIHSVRVKFCDCSTQPHRVQLLRARWFPATTDRPQTAMTFNALNTFHQLTVQSKISLYDFVKSLENLTDNTGTVDLPNRTRECMAMFRQWKYLKMLKRSLHTHRAADLNDLAPGSLAVECAACPHPTKNMPPDWRNACPAKKYIYRALLSMDANFRLKGKERSLTDIELGSGLSYFLESKAFNERLRDVQPQAEVNTCESNLHAVNHADSRFSKGYSVNGVVLVICARHSMFRPLGVCDLQLGEKYWNTDQALGSTVSMWDDIPPLVLTYDIACQWSKNFASRMARLPGSMRPSIDLSQVTFAIPKFHLPAHGAACQAGFSLNYIPGVGRTDGEGIERDWAHLKGIGASTSEMAPGLRHETVSDHLSSWNWRQIKGFGDGLRKKLCRAIENIMIQQGLFDEFSKTFPSETIAEWEELSTIWENDLSKTNPYVEKEKANALADVRKALADEEASFASAQNSPQINLDITPSAFLSLALEIEEQQRNIRITVKSKTALQSAEAQEKKTSLFNRISALQHHQDKLMPYIAPLRDPDSETADISENIPLWLPSELPVHLRPASHTYALFDKEIRLRQAQARDALTNLRSLLRVKKGLEQWKREHVSGQGPGTRARSLISTYDVKVFVCAERYRSAYAALLALDPEGECCTGFQHLKNEDLKPPGYVNPDKGGKALGDGYIGLSWIWRVSRAGENNEEEMHESLQVEYSRSRARLLRWKEECRLVVEEMRRVVAFLEVDAMLWRTIGRNVAKEAEDIVHGRIAYGHRQCAQRLDLRRRFVGLWKPVLSKYSGLIVDGFDWIVDLTSGEDEERQKVEAKEKHSSGVDNVRVDEEAEGLEYDDE